MKSINSTLILTLFLFLFCSNKAGIALVNTNIRGTELKIPKGSVFKKHTDTEKSLALESLKEYSLFIASDESFNFFVTYNIMEFKENSEISEEAAEKMARNTAIYTAERIDAKEKEYTITHSGNTLKYSGVFISDKSKTYIQNLIIRLPNGLKMVGCTSRYTNKLENDEVLNSVKF